jgi:type I restriction enzyme, R subunit
VVYEIGQSQLLALRESSADETVKVLNLRKLLAGLVEEEGAAKPYLLSIGERAQALAEAFDDRQIDTREALKRFEALIQETIDAETRRRDLKLDANGFAIYTALEATKSAVTPRPQAQAINGLFGQHPDYRWNGQQESALRADLYKVLRPIVGAGQMVAAANAMFRLERV